MIETIKERRSIRTFEPTPITKEDFQILEDYLKDEAHLIGPFGTKVRFELILVQNNRTDQGVKLGTYGFIKNHQGYIVGMTKNKKMDLVEFGYIFEKLILFATKLGIGTCWIGGTFNRQSFAKELNLQNDEFIPCITPIGYPTQKQRLFDKTIRYVTKADNKKEWEQLFFYQGFTTPLTKQEADNFSIPIEMVRLGPSASNKQPWRLILSEDKKQVHFFLAHTPNYNKLGFNMQLIDIGIAMYHFEVTCNELQLSGRWNSNNPEIPLPNQFMDYIISWEVV